MNLATRLTAGNEAAPARPWTGGFSPPELPLTRADAALPLHLCGCDGETFDRVAAGFDDAPPEQVAAFAAERWLGRRIEHRLAVRRGEVVAAATIVLVRALGTGIAAVKWGPLWRPRGRRPDASGYRDMMAALIDEYSTRRGFMLSVMPPADPVADGVADAALTEAGFSPGEQDRHPDRYFLDLAPSLEAIRGALASKWRYNLVKSETAGFSVRRLHGPEGLRVFMPLYQAMLSRKAFHDDSAIGAIPALYESPEHTLHPLTFLVEAGGAPVAGAVVSVNGDTARYLHGASTDEGLAQRPGYLMHWEVIRWLKENARCRWYALGGTDGFSGLAQFKKGLVGRSGRIVAEPPAFHYAPNRWAGAVGQTLYALRRIKARAAARLRLPWR